ncbi:GntR family transcriptional regulator [Candidatus Formimonas warabiya]|uniref:GntR family transcriptional regulator n=1 Tax=Formimonas warabiya TaxID=1761012 RepID=A0A3G1KSQ4_FORW1|nr:GntR family transcriptional regulator [Candidatus Formimonas warabiya]ATW25444.1 GntR family transcriptional regulator [Candidatus Formimonas warabiya]
MILRIDMTSDIPIYQQIRNQIVFGVAKGDVKPGDSLPTVRQLANDIGVNPMTVNKAYALLREEGIIVIDRRHGAQISNRGMNGNAFDPDFDHRAELLVSEARMKGASKQEIKKHFSDLIDMVYE